MEGKMADEFPPTIHSPELFAASLSAGFDGVLWWDHWAAAIGRRAIRPSDIDLIVEINGHFIVVESKNEGASISQGQQLLLEALRLTGLFVIIEQYGKDWGYRWRWRALNTESEWFHARSKEEFVKEQSAFIKKWADYMDKLPDDEWRIRLVEAAVKGASEECLGKLRELMPIKKLRITIDAAKATPDTIEQIGRILDDAR
jgi:hypothetical protein